MKTRTGLAFMTLFNAWYFSFSPPLASHLGTHRTQRVVFGYALYPLIGLLYASYYAYILISPVNNEIAAVTAGLVAAAMIGFVYLAPPLYITKRVLRRKITTHSRLNQDYLLALSAASSLAMGFSYSAGFELALGFAAASLLLSFLTLGVIAGNFALEHVRLRYIAQQLALLNDVCKTLTIHTISYVHRQALGPET
jgi:cation transport ATPase